MLVKTPAIKLSVEIREARLEEGRIVFKGVAGAMPCTVDMAPHEVLSMAWQMFRPPIFKGLVAALFIRRKETSS